MPNPFDNQQFETYSQAIRQIGKKVTETEDLATGLVNLLYENLKDENGQQLCGLIRFFRTMPFEKVPPELKTKLLQSHGKGIAAQTKCLTLLATRGLRYSWNDPRKSEEHQCILLQSGESLEETPMISGLLKQLGVDINQVVSSEPGIFLAPEKKQYTVFYVPEAKNSNLVPAQEDFVIPYEIGSVVGFGSQLASGELFAVLLFLRCHVDLEVAKRFSALAKDTELAILEIGQRNISATRILIAASEQGSDRLKRILAGKHRVTCIETLGQVPSILENEKFDLIIAGMHFDDSRTFQFLKMLKSHVKFARKPLICMLLQKTQLSDKLMSNMESVVGIMGAKRYLDATEMSDDDLLRVVESYIPEPVWDTTGSYKAIK